MADWQPIETAPKDGTTFLAWNGWRSIICAWASLYLMSRSGEIWGWVDTGGAVGKAAEPTHWMPLPTPPAEV